MKNISYKIGVFLFSLLLLQSCLLDDSVTDFGKGPVVVQFPTATASPSFVKDASNKVYDYVAKVQYFGGDGFALSKEVTATIDIDPTSVAKEGVEFTIPNKQVVFASGSNTADVIVKVNSANLSTTKAAALVLKIKESSVTVSNNKSIMKINLLGK